jgi:chemotaxis protein methyltransferase CheR
VSADAAGSGQRAAPRIARDEFALIRQYIESACGISLGEDKTYLVETRLTELLGEQGCHTFYELYRRAKDDTSNTLRDKIIDAITTRETFWFRDATPFESLRDVALGELAAQFRGGRRTRVRIWCAGCATGQEPYSVAMSILEYCRLHGHIAPARFDILATDIATAALYVARSGRYGAMEIQRGLTEELRDRYFSRTGAVWILNDLVRNMVTFERHNLQDSLSHRGPFDIVFLRNVLIYFADTLKRELLERVRESMLDSGMLILGAAEAVSRYSTRFRMVRSGAGMYYRPC